MLQSEHGQRDRVKLQLPALAMPPEADFRPGRSRVFRRTCGSVFLAVRTHFPAAPAVSQSIHRKGVSATFDCILPHLF